MIDVTTDIRPVTDLHVKAAEIMETIAKTGRPVILTKNGRAAFTISDAKSYNKIAYQHYLDNMVERSEADITAGWVHDMPTVHAELRRKFGAS